ncbi:hypothetical protein FKW50_14745, partial [Acetobacter pomorum]
DTLPIKLISVVTSQRMFYILRLINREFLEVSSFKDRHLFEKRQHPKTFIISYQELVLKQLLKGKNIIAPLPTEAAILTGLDKDMTTPSLRHEGIVVQKLRKME